MNTQQTGYEGIEEIGRMYDEAAELVQAWADLTYLATQH